jgi:predicted NBD/HSP70 family sugar kinase
MMCGEMIPRQGCYPGFVALVELALSNHANIVGAKKRGLPGAVRPDPGIVLLPGRLKGLENFPLVPRLQRTLAIPVIADNDARLAMIAEKEYGLARGKKWALTVTLGTGVGSGVLIVISKMKDRAGLLGAAAQAWLLARR